MSGAAAWASLTHCHSSLYLDFERYPEIALELVRGLVFLPKLMKREVASFRNFFARVRRESGASQARVRQGLLRLMLSTIAPVCFAAVDKPVFIPSASDSATAIDVTITCGTANALIRYTLNGEDPTSGDPVVRSSGSIRIAKSTTLKAVAWKGGEVSEVAEEYYRVTGAIAMGGQHGLALSRAGKVWSWGYQANGRLGNGQSAGIAVLDPVRVLASDGFSNLDDAAGIAAGMHHSVVLGSNGEVQSFGWGVYGSLGHGLTSDSSLPVSVLSSSASGPPLTGVRSISAGEYFSLAALQTGEVYSWGLRNNGRLGDGLTSGNRAYAMPVQRGDDPSFPSLDGIHEVASGPSFNAFRERFFRKS